MTTIVLQTKNWMVRNALQEAIAQAVKRAETEVKTCSELIASGKHDAEAVGYFRASMQEAKRGIEELRGIRVTLEIDT